MQKLFIKNRKQQNISVIVENENWKWWLVFVMHGLWDDKDSLHIIEYAKPFLDNDFVVIRFDTTNTFWESDWNFENATLTNYYEDLEDVIKWSSSQNFYKEKFILIWHSLWAICSALYSQNNSSKVSSLIMISSPINFELSKSTYSIEELKKWEETWILIEDWWALQAKLKWEYMEDKKKYDLLKNPENFTMPTLIIAWENDETTPYKHQKLLFDKILSKKEIYIVKNWPHTFREESHLNEIKILLTKWINKLN